MENNHNHNQPTKLERRERLLLTADLMKSYRPAEILKILEDKGYSITSRQLSYDLKDLQADMQKEITVDEHRANYEATLSEIDLLRTMALEAGDRKEMRMLAEFKAKVQGVITNGNKTEVNVQNNTQNNVNLDFDKLDKQTLKILTDAGMKI